MKNPNCPQNPQCPENPFPPVTPPCNNHPPHFHDFPNLCPPPAPMPPCNPPAPSVVEGQSIYQAVNNLTNRVNTCIATYNDVMAHCYQTLRNLEKAAQENGSYYGPCDVWTEEGYLPDQSATYTLIHKNAVDRRNEPIFMQLHLAYGNTTNSMVSQGLASASKITYADKIFTAQPIRFKTVEDENSNTLPQESASTPTKIQLGWYGNAIWQGCPIQTTSEPNLYTVGFTRSGLMRVYNNTATIDQMLRDTIENAMGCPGVLIQNGQITDSAWYETIPNYSEQAARVVMGQNTETREVIILVCGNENNVNKKGMTSQAAANILLQYGCTVAVELTEGSSAGAMDKGSLLFVPDNDTIPEAYCFWYITRSRFYCNDYERELAELMQNYGEAIWQTYLNKKRIDKLQAQITQEITDRIEGDEALKAEIEKEIARATQAETWLQDNINSEVNRALQAEQWLQENINKEVNRATAAETALDEKITAEITRATTEDAKHDSEIEQLQNDLHAEIHNRENEDAILHQDILTEQGARIAADTNLQTNINTEAATRADEDQKILDQVSANISTLTTAISNLEADITKLNGLYQQLTNSMAELDTTVAAQQQTITTFESTLNEIKTTIAGIQDQLAELDGKYLRLTGGTMQGPIDMNENFIQNVKTPVSDDQAANKEYVDQAVANVSTGKYLQLSGGSMTGPIDMANHGLNNVPTPQNEGDAANKDYVDDLTTENKNYIDAQINAIPLNDYVKKSGDSMTGPLAMEQNKITGVAAPTSNNDATNKKYVDDIDTNLKNLIAGIDGDVEGITAALNQYVSKSGSTMTGNLEMSSGSKVTGQPVPTEDSDVTPKSYVDNIQSDLLSQLQDLAAKIADLPETLTGFVKKIGDTMTGTLQFAPSSNSSYSNMMRQNTNSGYVVQQTNRSSPSGPARVNFVTFNPDNSRPDDDNTILGSIHTPLLDTDASNKQYADSKVSKTGDTMTGPLNLRGNTETASTGIRLENSAFGGAGQMSAQLQVLNINNKRVIDLYGSAIAPGPTGNQFPNANILRNVDTPLNQNDAANKYYVDSKFYNITEEDQPHITMSYIANDHNTGTNYSDIEIELAPYGTNIFWSCVENYSINGLVSSDWTKSIWLEWNWKYDYDTAQAQPIGLDHVINLIKTYGSYSAAGLGDTAYAEYDYEGFVFGVIALNNASNIYATGGDMQFTYVEAPTPYLKIKVILARPAGSSVTNFNGYLLNIRGMAIRGN